MADEPYYTPGQSDNRPPQSPTEFSPQKPVGPDPVTPQPLAEGSESEKHAQLFALDPASGNFLPVEWKDGKLKVDAVLDGSDIEIGAVEIKNRDTDDRMIVDPDGSAHVTIVDKINGLPFTTTIIRDPGTGLVSSVIEAAGGKTKTSTLTRDAEDNVATITEAIV